MSIDNSRDRLNFDPGDSNKIFRIKCGRPFRVGNIKITSQDCTFATKLFSFTRFKMLFSAAVKDFVHIAWIKI